MRSMKISPYIPVLTFAVLVLGSCESDPLLRDRYMGQGLIEPELLQQIVRRDQLGNPILTKKPEVKVCDVAELMMDENG